MPTLLESQVESRRLVLPRESNAIRTAHGGDVLKWMEQTAAMSGMHFSASGVVTAGFDHGRFHNPIPQGAIALIDAYVYEVGSSSMTIRVRVFHENHETGERILTTDARVVTVAVDDDGESVDVPALEVDSDRGQRLQAEALNAEE